jgi:DedD protein
MTSNESPDFGPAPGEEDESARIRRKLLWRMGVAGLMIVALLGGLTLFDHLATAPREPEYLPPRFTEPVPVPPKPVTQTLGPVVPMPAEEEETEKPLQTSDTSVPEATTAPAIPADSPPAELASPPPPDVAARPAPSRATTKPPSRAAATVPPLTPPSPPSPARTEQETGQKPSLPRPETARAEASRPEALRPETTRTLPSRQSSTLPRPLPGYTLQAGVFTDPRRAEEIHTRLAQEGIPVTLETRVLVGPFRNRNEAESARAKMKAMGIDALLMPRNGRK